jgi:hypothetical protein
MLSVPTSVLLTWDRLSNLFIPPNQPKILSVPEDSEAGKVGRTMLSVRWVFFLTLALADFGLKKDAPSAGVSAQVP